MPLVLLIERWFAIGFLIFGLSHLLYPNKWTALFLPLRDRPAGGLLVATFTLPVGLFVVLAHNIWVWAPPVIVTFVGWGMTVKSVFYLFHPRALHLAMRDERQMQKGFRIAGVMMILFGAVLSYDSFYK